MVIIVLLPLFQTNYAGVSMKRSSFVVKPADIPAYAPAGAHRGTVNRRLISGRNFELILGEMAAGGMAETHFHGPEEQAVYLLEGKCRVEIEGKSQEILPGEAVYFAPGQPHKLTPIGGPVKILVIYAPPFLRGPAPSKHRPISNKLRKYCLYSL
jgi:quercetin dioxygenase-like cupin family protein